MLSEGIPPPSRNHRTPTAADTPAAAAASSLERPAAIARQNRCRSSRLATDGRPGDRIGGRPARSAARRRTAPIATLLIEALRGPLEFALAAAGGVMNRARGLHLAAPPDRHLECRQHQVDGLRGADGVAEAVAAPGVLDHRDVGGSAEGDDLREVRDPEL